jgi:lipoprotein-anchoring transpeptidase ErfK/SrfK
MSFKRLVLFVVPILLLVLCVFCASQIRVTKLPRPTPTGVVTQIFPTPTLLQTPSQTLIPPPTSTQEIVPTSTTPPASYTFHVIESVDTIESISARYGISIEELNKTNNLEVEELLLDGHQLLIAANYTSPNPPAPEVRQGKEIITVLSTQKVYAFENGELSGEFLVSTGLYPNLTVVGYYYIYDKQKFAYMSGPDYDLHDVPSTMYFFEGYSFHGTYWHDNFGHPMSHGCINMSKPDAKWLFDWTDKNTLILILP